MISRFVWFAGLFLAAFAMLSAPRAFADVPPDVLQVFSNAAAALANDDSAGFLDQFDPSMPGYSILRANVEALLAANELTSTIDPITDEGDGQMHSVQLDWLLAINSKEGRSETRRGIVKCVVQRQGRRWKIISLEPIDFFRP
jgi:hypothetical protein